MMRRAIVTGIFAQALIAQEFASLNREILPILRQHCFECHNRGVGSPGPSLLLMGYNSGTLASPGALLDRLEGKIPGKPRMPLGKPPLPEEKIMLLRRWYEEGVQGGKAFPIETQVDALRDQRSWSISCLTPVPAILVVQAGEGQPTTPRFADAGSWATWSIRPGNADTIRLTVQPIGTDDPGTVIFIAGDAPLDSKHLSAQANCGPNSCFELLPNRGQFRVWVPGESNVVFRVKPKDGDRLAVERKETRPAGTNYFGWDLKISGKEPAMPGEYSGVFDIASLRPPAHKYSVLIHVTLIK